MTAVQPGMKITDGLVEWTVRFLQNDTLQPYGNAIIQQNDDLNDYLNFGTYTCESGAVADTLSNCPHQGSNFKLVVIANTGNGSSLTGWQMLMASENHVYFRTRMASKWSDWNQLATTAGAIVAASLNNQGYVKFGNGFIVQWGYLANTITASQSQGEWVFPVKFTAVSHVFVEPRTTNNQTLTVVPTVEKFTIYRTAGSGEIGVDWFAVGY